MKVTGSSSAPVSAPVIVQVSGWLGATRVSLPECPVKASPPEGTGVPLVASMARLMFPVPPIATTEL